MILTSIFFAGFSMLAASCDNETILRGNDNPPVIQSDLDQTTGYFSSTETAKCDLFYKPAIGYVGDPMPFYDPQSKDFKILYLQDMRDGNSVVYHPIYQLVTTDGASYQSLGETIACGSAAEDDPAIGTGSTVFDEVTKTYYTFYTGHKSASPREVILCATSSDCKSWTKDRSFRLQAPGNYNVDEFRDPHVFYDEDAHIYRMLLSAIRDGRSVIAQFTSSDLRKWNEVDPFFYTKWNRFYECPDVFKMGDYWYMIYSDKDVTRNVQYFYASTLQGLMNMGDDPAFPYLFEGKLEGLSFYAGKTAGDGTNRYLWGWCATRAGNTNEKTTDWAGALVAHKLVQHADGTLGLTYPDAVYNTCKQAVALTEMSKTEGATGDALNGYQLNAGQSVRFARLQYVNKVEMKITTTPGTSVFGVSLVDCSDRDYKYGLYIEDRWDNLKFDKVTSLDEGGEERTNINSKQFIHAADGVYQVTVVSDHSVCVVYINGQYAFTNRIYGMQRNPWGIFCSDGSITVSDLKYTVK